MKPIYSLKIALSTAFVFFTIIGCETNSSFLSNNKLKKVLQGTWQLIPALSRDSKQTWKFDDTGSLYITDSVGASSKTGAYTVDAGFLHSYVNVSGFNQSYKDGKWTVVTVDNNILSMTISNVCSGKQKCGVLMREFTKQQ